MMVPSIRTHAYSTLMKRIPLPSPQKPAPTRALAVPITTWDQSCHGSSGYRSFLFFYRRKLTCRSLPHQPVIILCFVSWRVCTSSLHLLSSHSISSATKRWKSWQRVVSPDPSEMHVILRWCLAWDAHCKSLQLICWISYTHQHQQKIFGLISPKSALLVDLPKSIQITKVWYPLPPN
jgi:hypothetical protein